VWALGACPDNELAGAGLVVDALTVIRNSEGVDLEGVVGEVSIMCKRFQKENDRINTHSIICEHVFWLLLLLST